MWGVVIVIILVVIYLWRCTSDNEETGTDQESFTPVEKKERTQPPNDVERTYQLAREINTRQGL